MFVKEYCDEINAVSDKKDVGKKKYWASEFREALSDIMQGLKMWKIWWCMASADIRRRYRRTLLGPFWTTLSLAIFIGSSGFLFSKLWKMDMATYMPFFCSGFICWSFISAIITEGCSVFVISEGLIKQLPLPYSLYAWHVLARNFLVLMHHSIVYALVMCFFHVQISPVLLLIVPGLILLCLTGVWVIMLIGLICARYRDFQQVISSLLQISIFITPIFWPVSQLGDSQNAAFFINCNLLYHYVNVIRAPLLGQMPSLLSWLIVLGMTSIGWVLTFFLFVRKRRMLVVWL